MIHWEPLKWPHALGPLLTDEAYTHMQPGFGVDGGQEMKAWGSSMSSCSMVEASWAITSKGEGPTNETGGATKMSPIAIVTSIIPHLSLLVIEGTRGALRGLWCRIQVRWTSLRWIPTLTIPSRMREICDDYRLKGWMTCILNQRKCLSLGCTRCRCNNRRHH